MKEAIMAIRSFSGVIKDIPSANISETQNSRAGTAYAHLYTPAAKNHWPDPGKAPRPGNAVDRRRLPPF